MRRIIITFLLSCCFCFIANEKEVAAAEAVWEQGDSSADEIDYEKVKQIIQTETIYDTNRKEEILLRSSYQSKKSCIYGKQQQVAVV